MRFAVLISICLILLPIGALSADERVVVIDPNADGSITSKTYAQTDPQLSQTVSYEAEHESVQRIIADLRQMTGVKLAAGARESDWPVRSRRMSIFVKNVPLCELMDSIARVMKFRWSRYDETMTYRLKVNRKAAAEADAMMKRAEKKQEEMWRKRRHDWADAIDKYGDKSASELASLRDTDPQIYEQALLGSLQAAHALFEEVPEAKERFIEGKNFRISTDLLDSQTKSLLFNAGNEFWKHLQRIGYITGQELPDPPGYGDVLKADDHFDIVYKRLDVGTFTPNLRWGGASVSDTGYWHLYKNGRDFEINGFRYLGTPWNRHISVGNIRINEGENVREVRTSEADAGMAGYAAYLEDAKKLEEFLYPSEPLVQHAVIPQLEQKIMLKLEKPQPKQDAVRTAADEVSAVQKALFEAAGLNIVSDSWAAIPLDYNVSIPDGEAKLSELIDKLCSRVNSNWDKSGPIVDFWHRKWAKLRLTQIPADWVEQWSNHTRKNGYLSLNDLADISHITYYQAAECLQQDPVIGVTGTYGRMLNILDDNLQWLQLYALLKPQQRKILTGERGLNGHMLTSEQWKLAQVMLDRIGLTRGEALMKSGTLTGDEPNKLNVWFEVIDIDSGETDRFWRTELPLYRPPQQTESASK